MIIAAFVFLFSGVMILDYCLELRSGKNFSESISEEAVTENPKQDFIEEDPQKGEGISDESEEPQKSESAPIQVDFELLRAQNKDVVAWIHCPDTPINYPIVQALDNEFYLRRLLDGSYNSSGTLFMDFRNSADFSDWNSIIYGHNMKNDSMFGTLPLYAEQSYFDEHPVIYLLTPERNYKINVFAGFVTPATSEFYNILDPGGEEKEMLIKEWLAASDFDSETGFTSDERFITLSTCSYDYSDARYVIIGILEEIN